MIVLHHCGSSDFPIYRPTHTRSPVFAVLEPRMIGAIEKPW